MLSDEELTLVISQVPPSVQSDKVLSVEKVYDAVENGSVADNCDLLYDVYYTTLHPLKRPDSVGIIA
jgi:hypothetical protein